jgi:hypothetical protein
MPNKALQNRSYTIPDKVINRISQMLKKLTIANRQAKGLQRAQNMVNTRKMTYIQMNKLKHYFETYKGDGNDDEFKLLGGTIGKKWITDSNLEKEKDSEAKIKDAQMNAGIENTHIKTHEKDNDNSDPTAGKGGMVDITSMKSKNIMNNTMTYKSSDKKHEGYNKEIGSMLYLIEYMNKNK